MLQCRQVQVDPLDVVGHSHDLAFASRVDGYRAEDLDAILYNERSAYEHGGSLFIFPRESLGLQWSELHHRGITSKGLREWREKNAAAVRTVLHDIRTLGPLESRYWLDGERTEDYRSRRHEGIALHYLWREMEIFIHHRVANRKFYDLRERLFGPTPKLLSLEETRAQSAVNLTRWLGLSGRFWLTYLPGAPGGPRRTLGVLRAFRQHLVAAGHVTTVDVEGSREPAVLWTGDLPRLEQVAAGEVPREWKPLVPQVEAVFLAPLEVVSTRGRARTLFDFDYLWEVYKPAAQRRWGYYVLPVLVGDRLVGRIEPTQDSARQALVVQRAWWEDGVNPRSLAEPIARGLRRSATGLGLSTVRLGRVGPASFRLELNRQLNALARTDGPV